MIITISRDAKAGFLYKESDSALAEVEREVTPDVTADAAAQAERMSWSTDWAFIGGC